MTLLDVRSGVPTGTVTTAPVLATEVMPAVSVAPTGPRPGSGRPCGEARFLAVGGERLWVRGVTYGTFAPGERGDRFPDRSRVVGDFSAMTAAGINTVRLYTVPPRWVLDAAADAGLWVMVGLPWEQHVAFLADRRRADAIVERVRVDAATCAGHPAVLCFAIGNEIPAAIVRWHGRRAVERFLKRLCNAVRGADPGALVTYVNFPSTEYLRLPFVDIVSFNVYLEDDEKLAGYVARLANLAGERPLILAEVGLDSSRNGLVAQAHSLGRQVDVAFRGGCAGACVFAWTDEWHRGEDEVVDWDFGLTDRDRRGKPALDAVHAAFTRPLPHLPADPPLVSVVVCTYNGAATLGDCLEGVAALRYPRYEILVVDDGSTDDSAAIAAGFGARVISTPNGGLSAARNRGLAAARGEIVAYLDDDARPDPDWLTYLAATFRDTDHAAVGGPNVPPLEETGVAECVANAPGGPSHVLISDTEAEHLPGCNLAIRADALRAIGGFDPQFVAAGDDVDVCWRLQAAGMTLGFHPGAQVWHRRRPTIRRYWRQQRGYGRAEALLERKWPENYNVPGHATWGGRLYGGILGGLVRRSRVYHGTWGTGAFQREVERPAGPLTEFTAAPEWLLVIALLGALSLLGTAWAPLLSMLPLFVLATLATIVHAGHGARGARFARRHDQGSCARMRLSVITFILHLLQPAARLCGRIGYGLTPWRRPRVESFVLPTRRERELWSETWQAPERRLRRVEAALRARGGRVRTGGPCDRWEFESAGGAFGAARLRAAFEDHGRGRQLTRARVWPRVPRTLVPAVIVLVAAAAAAAEQHAWTASALIFAVATTFVVATARECGVAIAAALSALEDSARDLPDLELVTGPDA